jgi:hypothetical protein
MLNSDCNVSPSPAAPHSFLRVPPQILSFHLFFRWHAITIDESCMYTFVSVLIMTAWQTLLYIHFTGGETTEQREIT